MRHTTDVSDVERMISRAIAPLTDRLNRLDAENADLRKRVRELNHRLANLQAQVLP